MWCGGRCPYGQLQPLEEVDPQQMWRSTASLLVHLHTCPGCVIVVEGAMVQVCHGNRLLGLTTAKFLRRLTVLVTMAVVLRLTQYICVQKSNDM